MVTVVRRNGRLYLSIKQLGASHHHLVIGYIEGQLSILFAFRDFFSVVAVDICSTAPLMKQQANGCNSARKARPWDAVAVRMVRDSPYDVLSQVRAPWYLSSGRRPSRPQYRSGATVVAKCLGWQQWTCDGSADAQTSPATCHSRAIERDDPLKLSFLLIAYLKHLSGWNFTRLTRLARAVTGMWRQGCFHGNGSLALGSLSLRRFAGEAVGCMS